MTSYFSSQRFGLVQDRLGCIPVLIMCVNYMHNMYLDFMNILGYLEVYLTSNYTLIKTSLRTLLFLSILNKDTN